MRIVVVLFLIFTLPYALAEAEGFDVKGVHLGITEQEAREILGPNFTCGTIIEQFQDKTDLTTRFCTVKVPNTPVLSHNDSFAGIPTIIQYYIVDGKVDKINFASIPAEKFESTVSILSSKYGQGSASTSTIKNRMGAEFENKMVQWNSPRGDVIVYEKYGRNLDYSTLSFYSPEGWKLLQTILAKEVEYARDDL